MKNIISFDDEPIVTNFENDFFEFSIQFWISSGLRSEFVWVRFQLLSYPLIFQIRLILGAVRMFLSKFIVKHAKDM